MALRKRGEVYYVYYNENGRRVEKSTGCTRKKDAVFAERQIMNRRRIARACRRMGVTVDSIASDGDSGSGRIRLDSLISIAEKHRKISREAGIYWRTFLEKSGLEFVDDCTPVACQRYLDRQYGSSSPKTYNNAKTYLNNIFKACYGETGISSPFERLLNRKLEDVRHHRAYTDVEVGAILAQCNEFWRFMVLLSLHTGMSKETCLRFCPAWIEDINGAKWIRFSRSKTARFGRQCLVPVKPAVLELISPLSSVKGAVPYVSMLQHSTYDLQKGFADILSRAGIKDTVDGAADFHSLRATFISRCRAAAIPEHAIRSMVGHVSSQTTDLYSHDLTTPLQVLKIK